MRIHLIVQTLVDRKCVDLVDNYQQANSSETEFVKRPKLFHFRTYRVRTNIIASSVTANKNNKQLNISSKTSRKSMSNWPAKEQETFYEEIRIEIDESNLRSCKGNGKFQIFDFQKLLQKIFLFFLPFVPSYRIIVIFAFLS